MSDRSFKDIFLQAQLQVASSYSMVSSLEILDTFTLFPSRWPRPVSKSKNLKGSSSTRRGLMAPSSPDLTNGRPKYRYLSLYTSLVQFIYRIWLLQLLYRPNYEKYQQQGNRCVSVAVRSDPVAESGLCCISPTNTQTCTIRADRSTIETGSLVRRLYEDVVNKGDVFNQPAPLIGYQRQAVGVFFWRDAADDRVNTFVVCLYEAVSIPLTPCCFGRHNEPLKRSLLEATGQQGDSGF